MAVGSWRQMITSWVQRSTQCTLNLLGPGTNIGERMRLVNVKPKGLRVATFQDCSIYGKTPGTARQSGTSASRVPPAHSHLLHAHARAPQYMPPFGPEGPGGHIKCFVAPSGPLRVYIDHLITKSSNLFTKPISIDF